MKYKYLRKTIVWFGLCILILVGSFIVNKILTRKHFSEKPLPPQISISIKSGVNLRQLTPESAVQLKEISIFRNEQKDGVPVAIEGSADISDLFVLYENGKIYRWDLQSHDIIASDILFAGQKERRLPVYLINAGVSFSKDGKYAITPNEILSNGIYGLNYWDLVSRKLIYCNGEEKYCPGWPPGDDSVTSLQIHPIRDLFFTAHSHIVDGTYGFIKTNGTGGSFFIRTGQYEDPTISRLAIDTTGDYLAIADEKGNIQVGDISAHKQPMQNEQNNYGFSSNVYYRLSSFSDKKIKTVDLKFDETHSWLAWLTNQQLVIWSLHNYIFPLHLNIKLEEGNAIRFDHTGKLLAIATQNGFLIFDIEKGKIISEFPVGEVTALYFSKDNCMIMWGDSKGDIHIWGVPK